MQHVQDLQQEQMQQQPWYRHRWPWLLMLGPGIVLVAGVITTWIAFATSDGLVAEDWYKQGRAINRRLEKEDAARARGISIEIFLERETFRVKLQGESPEALFAHFAHATRAGYDQRIRLARAGGGWYEGERPVLPPGRWSVVIEDPRGTWRVAGR
jgi:hypothetical protein